jgi:5-methylcytosine-specific restriction endonuclease McrA
MAGDNAGRRGYRWRKLVANVKARGDACWLCGQPINYQATYPEPDSFVVDHAKSWINHPDLREDPANLMASHARCNAAKGSNEAPQTLGITSEEW